jgi:hypothetical protein
MVSGTSTGSLLTTAIVIPSPDNPKINKFWLQMHQTFTKLTVQKFLKSLSFLFGLEYSAVFVWQFLVADLVFSFAQRYYFLVPSMKRQWRLSRSISNQDHLRLFKDNPMSLRTTLQNGFKSSSILKKKISRRSMI